MKSVIKRILGTIPVLIGVVLLIFIMLRIVPGNAAAMLLEIGRASCRDRV